MKNLVMGFSTNLPEARVRIFCQSLRRVYSPDECDIEIVTNRFEPYFVDLAKIGVRFLATPNNYSKSTLKKTKAVNRLLLHSLRLLRRAGGSWIPEIAQAYPVLIETWHHPLLARWFAYHRLLSVDRAYRQVLLADVRDVVFQAPFFESDLEDGIVLFADAPIYGRDRTYNDKWYKDAYGATAFSKIRGRQIVCLGTVLGTHEALLGLLEEYTQFVAKSPFVGIDQTIFNHMLLSGKLSGRIKVVPNVDGQVATLASVEACQSLKVTDGAIRRTKDNSIVPVVHMYDRSPSLKEWLVGVSDC